MENRVDGDWRGLAGPVVQSLSGLHWHGFPTATGPRHQCSQSAIRFVNISLLSIVRSP